VHEKLIYISSFLTRLFKKNRAAFVRYCVDTNECFACRRLERRGKSLEDFDYSNEELMKEIYMAMNTTDFVGVSVRLVF